MKSSDQNPEGNYTIFALILTLILVSIYYSPELFKETSFPIQLSPIEANN